MRVSSIVPTLLLSLGVVPATHGWVAPATISLSHPPSRSLTQRGATEYTLDGTSIRGPIVPIGNLCLIRTKDALTSTGGGILLPDQSKERPTEGTVVSAGPGRLHPQTGVRMSNPVEEGMSVLYGKFDGEPLLYNDEQFQMIRDIDIMLTYTGAMLNYNNCQPFRDYILVQQEKETSETTSGIAIAASVTADDKPCEGVVAKVGEGRMTNQGEFTKCPFAQGDKVKFKDYAGTDVTIEGKSYSLVRMMDVLCSIQK